jgi:antitoxin (DNA-binding transcriptional repressor) of toxin-antitoxin stability system
MDQVGMRELRHRLRYYLGRVHAGERFEITLFGRPVAQLTPANPQLSIMSRLIAEGRVSPPANPDTSTLPATRSVSSGITATEALLAERRGDER